MEKIKNFINKVLNAIKNFFIKLKPYCIKVLNAIKNFFIKLKPYCIKVLNAIKNFFKIPKVTEYSKALIASIACILFGLIVGLLIMIIISLIRGNDDIYVSSAFKGIKLIMSGPFASKNAANVKANIGNMIFYSAPLIMTGLSVALAYKTGLFNIGAPGQYVMGTIGSLYVALSIQTTSRFEGVLVWILAIIVGVLCGMVWGAIPGILKAYYNVNEVIVCIMTNWIAANLASWFFQGKVSLQSTENTKAGSYLAKVLNNYTPKLGLDKFFPNSNVDIGIFIAIIIAIILIIILNKTTFGFELKACGFNKNASKYAGLNEKKNIILSMTIAGGLAGMGACLYYLNPGIEYKFSAAYSSLPSYGFNGIASAFLANCNPIGIIFSSLLIRYISMGGEYLTKVGLNRYIADVIIACIIYLAGFTRIMKEFLNKYLFNKKKVEADTRFKKEEK